MLPRERIIEAVRGQKGSDEQAELWIENVRVVHSTEAFTIATYEEWQGRAGQAARGWLSTVVFRPDAQAPNGLVWLHVPRDLVARRRVTARRSERFQVFLLSARLLGAVQSA